MTVIFRDDRYAIEHHKAPGGNGQLVLTFSYYLFDDLDAKGFGEKFLLEQGFDVIVFKSNANCWFQGISDDLLETVERIKARPNPQLDVLGVLVTLHDRRTTLSKDIFDQICQVFGDKVFDTTISRSVRLEESPAYRESSFTFAPTSSGAIEYAKLCFDFFFP